LEVFDTILRSRANNSLKTFLFMLLCDDELPGPAMRDAVLLAVLVEKVSPLQAELRLEAAGCVVNTGMNDLAVTAAGLLPKGSVALDQHNGKRPRTGAGKAFCQCQPNDASADYTKFKVFHWRPDFV
jgi:hypothetical protein